MRAFKSVTSARALIALKLILIHAQPVTTSRPLGSQVANAVEILDSTVWPGLLLLQRGQDLQLLALAQRGIMVERYILRPTTAKVF